MHTYKIPLLIVIRIAKVRLIISLYTSFNDLLVRPNDLKCRRNSSLYTHSRLHWFTRSAISTSWKLHDIRYICRCLTLGCSLRSDVRSKAARLDRRGCVLCLNIKKPSRLPIYRENKAWVLTVNLQKYQRGNISFKLNSQTKAMSELRMLFHTWPNTILSASRITKFSLSPGLKASDLSLQRSFRPLFALRLLEWPMYWNMWDFDTSPSLSREQIIHVERKCTSLRSFRSLSVNNNS